VWEGYNPIFKRMHIVYMRGNPLTGHVFIDNQLIGTVSSPNPLAINRSRIGSAHDGMAMISFVASFEV
jgi:hypothetical protein